MIPQFLSNSCSFVSTKISNGYQWTSSQVTGSVSQAYSATAAAISDRTAQVYEAAHTAISNKYQAAALKVSDAYTYTTNVISNQALRTYDASREAFQNYGIRSILASSLLAGIETWAISSATPSFVVTATRYVVITGLSSGILVFSYYLGEGNMQQASRSYREALIAARETLTIEAPARGIQLCHFATTQSSAARQWIDQRWPKQEGPSSISIGKISFFKETAETTKLLAQKGLEASAVALLGSTRLFEPLDANRTAVVLGMTAGLATLVLSGTVYQLDPMSCALIAAISSPILGNQYEKWERSKQGKLPHNEQNGEASGPAASPFHLPPDMERLPPFEQIEEGSPLGQPIILQALADTIDPLAV